MIWKMLCIGAAALISPACTSMTLQHYVGGDLASFLRRYGPPTAQKPLPTGQYAFSWVISGSKAPGASAPLDAFLPISSAPLPKRSAYARNGSLFGGVCVYTVIANWDARAERFIVSGFRAPSLPCE